MATQEPRLLAIAVRHRSRGAMQELAEAQVTPESGVADDFRGSSGRRQVTVLSLESWQAACEEAGNPQLPWTTRRANLLVTGVDLATASVLRIGEVELEVTGETAPCERMEEAFGGLRAALTPAWRGGVTCRVRQPGTLRPGVPVTKHPARTAEPAASAR
jgi:MOSC domain-containing protein YiiM